MDLASLISCLVSTRKICTTTTCLLSSYADICLCSGTEGLVRGRACIDTGNPIMIPVGPGTLGRIMNVTGDPIDERGPIKATKYASIHAEAPEFVDQSTTAEILVTGIKGKPISHCSTMD